MDKRVEISRKFWRTVLLAGGATAIPRWTFDAAPAVAELLTFLLRSELKGDRDVLSSHDVVAGTA